MKALTYELLLEYVRELDHQGWHAKYNNEEIAAIHEFIKDVKDLFDVA